MDPTQELAEAIDLLPPEYVARLRPIMDRVKEVTRRRSRVTQLIQECLSQIRLDMKYLIFDRDCLKKERDEAQL